MGWTRTARACLAAAATAAIAAACTTEVVPVPIGGLAGGPSSSSGGNAGSGGKGSSGVDAGSSVSGSSASSCPPQGTAAVCPPNPAWSGPDAWVGCQFSNCTSAGVCTSCSCIALDGAGAWACEETDAGPSATDAGLSDCELAGGQCRPGPSTASCTHVSTLACPIEPAGPYCCLDPHG